MSVSHPFVLQDQSVVDATKRREDPPLLRGDATFTDDITHPNALFMGVLRSEYGHANIKEIDASEAQANPSVVDVFTSSDIDRFGCNGPVKSTSGLYGVDDPTVPTQVRTPLSIPHRPLLARETVRYTGEPIAIVLAENRYSAQEGVEQISVTYDRLDAITDVTKSTERDVPRIHDDIPENTAFDWEIGDPNAVDEAFNTAAYHVSVDIPYQRINPTSIEPRVAMAEFDDDNGELTVYMSSQSPHAFKGLVSEMFDFPSDNIRVIAPSVGGGFGMKGKFHPAEPLVAWSAIHTGRPVKWQATRSEALRSDMHGRARTVHGELALDSDGTCLGLRIDSYADLGAYISRVALGTRTGSFVDVLTGQYNIPAAVCRVRGIFTNTAPVDSYRGSSRPQIILTLERLMERAAQVLDIDPVELRRRNFIQPEAFPFQIPVTEVYDGGEYERALDRACELVDYESIRDRQMELRDTGRFIGIGFSCLMDNAGTSRPENAKIEFDDTGSVIAYCGTADQGQGHGTTFAHLIADLLGVSVEDVQFNSGDTKDLPIGGGAGGSRCVVMGGEAVRRSAETVLEKARRIAAHQFEADPEDVAFDDGIFTIRGAQQRSIAIQEIGRLGHDESEIPAGMEPGLTATERCKPKATFPYGSHAAVVEVFPETGEIEIERYIAVDDCGRQLNPTLVRGQVIGGIAQGLGQALFEDAKYDETGTLVAGSLQDYALPRAHTIPEIRMDHIVTPSPYNPLGVKGVGECGTVGAPAAIVNAVCDALSPFEFEPSDLPLTPESIWRAVNTK